MSRPKPPGKRSAAKRSRMQTKARANKVANRIGLARQGKAANQILSTAKPGSRRRAMEVSRRADRIIKANKARNAKIRKLEKIKTGQLIHKNTGGKLRIFKTPPKLGGEPRAIDVRRARGLIKLAKYAQKRGGRTGWLKHMTAKPSKQRKRKPKN